MEIGAIIALLPPALGAIQEIALLIQKLQADGRSTTTEEEAAQLRITLGNVERAKQNFDDAFKDVP